MEILPGIHRIDGIRGVNAWLLEASDGLYIVDTGMPGHASSIVALITSLGRGPADVRAIILTHGDIDHVGNAAALRRLLKAPIAAHPADGPALRGEKAKQVKGFIGVVFRLMRPLVRFGAVTPDLPLSDGARLGPLRVIHAPGHTAGSVCLLSDGGVLFSGDALVTDRHGAPRPPLDAMTSDPDRARASVRDLAALDVSALLPGHGPPLLREASARLRGLASPSS